MALRGSALDAFPGEAGILEKELQGPPAGAGQGLGGTLGISGLAVPSGTKVKHAGGQGAMGSAGGAGGSGGSGEGGGEAGGAPSGTTSPGDTGRSLSPLWCLEHCGESGLEPSEDTGYLRFVSSTGSFFTSRGVKGDSSEAGEQVTGVGGNTSSGGR